MPGPPPKGRQIRSYALASTRTIGQNPLEHLHMRHHVSRRLNMAGVPGRSFARTHGERRDRWRTGVRGTRPDGPCGPRQLRKSDAIVTLPRRPRPFPRNTRAILRVAAGELGRRLPGQGGRHAAGLPAERLRCCCPRPRSRVSFLPLDHRPGRLLSRAGRAVPVPPGADRLATCSGSCRSPCCSCRTCRSG